MLRGKRLKGKKNLLVCIKCSDSSKGFTLVSVLFSLTLLILILPFLTILLETARSLSYERAVDAHHFFIFLRDDVIEASDVDVSTRTLTLTLITGNKATYSIYGDVIRRRIQNQGHEIYIRNIRDLTFSITEDRIRVELITTKGEQYEKEIQIYK